MGKPWFYEAHVAINVRRVHQYDPTMQPDFPRHVALALVGRVAAASLVP